MDAPLSDQSSEPDAGEAFVFTSEELPAPPSVGPVPRLAEIEEKALREHGYLRRSGNVVAGPKAQATLTGSL